MAPTNPLLTILLPFALATAAMFVLWHLLPQWPLTFYAPFLVIMIYKRPLTEVLFYALACGLFLDLLGGEHLGFHSITYMVGVIALSPLKKHFFADRYSTIPFFTVLFGALTAFLDLFLLSNRHVTIGWVGTDLLIMPLLDGVYAFLLFTLPGFLPRLPRREYFMTGRSR